jgi:ferredoxin
MRSERRLRVDIVACEGVGICAHLAPDVIRVDSWGFPIIDEQLIDRATEHQAELAVNACPRRALFLSPKPAKTG